MLSRQLAADANRRSRLREILEARWGSIELGSRHDVSCRSKTGRKTLYLSDAALAVLSGIARVDGNLYIIPGGKKGSHRADLKRPWSAIMRAAGLIDVVPERHKERETSQVKGQKTPKGERPSIRLHDLRHTFAAMGAGSSFGLPVIGKLLGHSQARTTHRYAHLDADPMHRAARSHWRTNSGCA